MLSSSPFQKKNAVNKQLTYDTNPLQEVKEVGEEIDVWILTVSHQIQERWHVARLYKVLNLLPASIQWGFIGAPVHNKMAEPFIKDSLMRVHLFLGLDLHWVRTLEHCLLLPNIPLQTHNPAMGTTTPSGHSVILPNNPHALSTHKPATGATPSEHSGTLPDGAHALLAYHPAMNTTPSGHSGILCNGSHTLLTHNPAIGATPSEHGGIRPNGSHALLTHNPAEGATPSEHSVILCNGPHALSTHNFF